MARRKKNGNGGAHHADETDTNLIHNKGARAEYINNYFAERYALDREVETAVEKHVQPIRDKRNTLNKNFRADLDFKEADVRGDYLNYKRRRDAELFDDEGERDKVLDNMRETYEATYGPDGQLNWGHAFDAEQEGVPKPGFLDGQSAQAETAGTA